MALTALGRVSFPRHKVPNGGPPPPIRTETRIAKRGAADVPRLWPFLQGTAPMTEDRGGSASETPTREAASTLASPPAPSADGKRDGHADDVSRGTLPFACPPSLCHRGGRVLARRAADGLRAVPVAWGTHCFGHGRYVWAMHPKGRGKRSWPPPTRPVMYHQRFFEDHCFIASGEALAMDRGRSRVGLRKRKRL